MTWNLSHVKIIKMEYLKIKIMLFNQTIYEGSKLG